MIRTCKCQNVAPAVRLECVKKCGWMDCCRPGIPQIERLGDQEMPKQSGSGEQQMEAPPTPHLHVVFPEICSAHRLHGQPSRKAIVKSCALQALARPSRAQLKCASCHAKHRFGPIRDQLGRHLGTYRGQVSSFFSLPSPCLQNHGFGPTRDQWGSHLGISRRQGCSFFALSLSS